MSMPFTRNEGFDCSLYDCLLDSMAWAVSYGDLSLLMMPVFITLSGPTDRHGRDALDFLQFVGL